MPRPSDTEFSKPSPRTPSPHINPVPLWPTPERRDLLFYVERNGDLPPNQNWKFGDRYIDPITYPNHKLVFVTPQTPDAWSKWYYASDRIEQDEYNWTFTDADIGGTKFKSVQRLYITPRKDFDPLVPAMGATMADAPFEKFTETYILASRDQVQVEDEVLRSLYVFEKRTYVKRVTVIDNEFNPELEQNLSALQTLYYRGETISGTPIETLVADEDNAYWGLTGTTARSGKQLSDNWFLVTTQKISVRRGTDGAISDDWPLKQVKSKGSEADIPALFADQISSIETITKLDLDAADVNDLPDPETPSGEEARILHKKVSDLHYERSVMEKVFNLTNEVVKTDVDQKPYVTIIQSTRGQATQEIPAEGIGSSELIWKAGDQKLYANMDQDSIARPGLKGFDRSSEQWGSYTERTDYSTDYTDGETSRVIYDDGETRVYEVTNVDAVIADGTTKDKDPQQWGFAIWDGTYDTAENVAADRSRQVWRRGDYRVYLNETVSTEVSGTTRDKDPQQWGDLVWTGTYSETQNLTSDRSKQVWRIGDNYVFLNEEVEVNVSGTTLDKDPQQWGTLTWNGTYDTATGGDRSRQVWRLGTHSVFLNETATVSADGTTKDKDPQQWGTLTWNGLYSLIDSDTADRSRQVWRLGDTKVFLHETAAVSVSGGTLDKDPQQWGFATWTGTYRANPDQPTIDASDRARQVWRLGTNTVYLTEEVAADVSGSTFDRDPQQWGDLEWNGTYSLNPDQPTIEAADRSKQVWRVGDQSVYLLEEATLDASGTTKDKDPQQWGTLTWDGDYILDPSEIEIADADRARQVFRLGDQFVYLLEDATVAPEGTTLDLDPREWGKLTWNGNYQSTATSLNENYRSRQVYRLGAQTVYLVEEPALAVNEDTFISYRESNALLTEEHETYYSLTPIALPEVPGANNVRCRIAFALGSIRVYENTTILRASVGTITYAGTVNVDLPPVLTSLDIIPFPRRDGDDSYELLPNIKPGYRGPMACTVSEVWQQGAGASFTQTVFRPDDVHISSPIASVRVSGVLHGLLQYRVTVGTQHPVFEFSNYDFTFPATSPADWPTGAFVAHVDSQPYQGGYVVRTYTVTLAPITP